MHDLIRSGSIPRSRNFRILVFEFLSVVSLAGSGFHVRCRKPGIYSAADLLDRQAGRRLAVRPVVLLTDARAKQVAELRDEKMAMDATPAAHFVMIQPQLLLRLPETALHRPTIEGHVQQPAQCDSLFARHTVSHEIFPWLTVC